MKNFISSDDIRFEATQSMRQLAKGEEVGTEILNKLSKSRNIPNFEDTVLSLLKQNRTLAEIMFFSCFKKLEENYMAENPFIKNIKFENEENKDYTIFFEEYKEDEIFSFEANNIYPSGVITFPLATLSENIDVPTIKIKDKIFSPTPTRIHNLSNYINKAEGNILIFGLKDSYLPYMLSLKEDIASITVIEEDLDLINFYKEKLEKQVNIHNKINVIHKKTSDVFLNRNYLKEFNSIYIDLWESELDGLNLYLDFKEKEKGLNIYYWNEELFFCRARILLLSYLSQDYEFLKYDFFTRFKIKINKFAKELQPEIKKLNTADEIFELTFKKENIERLLSIKS